MRIPIRYVTIAFCLTVFTGWSFAQAEQASEKPSEEKIVTLQKIPSSLEAMLARALEANPDILVAEADHYHAQTVVKQMRLRVSQALIEAYHQLKMRQNALQDARHKYARMERLFKEGLLDEDSLITHRQGLLPADAAVAEIEAMIRGIMGVDPLSGKTPESLEEMLTIALRSNGEIMLAEADLIRMDARLNQTRLKVTEEVTIAFQMLRITKNALGFAQHVWQKTEVLVDKNLDSKDAERSAFQAMIEAEAELVQFEAHIRYLLGLGGIVQARKKSGSGGSK